MHDVDVKSCHRDALNRRSHTANDNEIDVVPA
jgi:hypothetical protein